MKKMFLDCGAWEGISTQYFLDNHPDAGDFEVHAFECNPPVYEILKERFKDNTQVRCWPTAVWKDADPINLYTGEGAFTESSSLYKSKRTGNLDVKNPVLVETTHLSQFLQLAQPEDTVILKMNMEGAEYEVIPDLVRSGAVESVDFIFIDWHINKIPSITQEVHDKAVEMLEGSGVPYAPWALDHDHKGDVKGDYDRFADFR